MSEIELSKSRKRKILFIIIFSVAAVITIITIITVAFINVEDGGGTGWGCILLFPKVINSMNYQNFACLNEGIFRTLVYLI